MELSTLRRSSKIRQRMIGQNVIIFNQNLENTHCLIWVRNSNLFLTFLYCIVQPLSVILRWNYFDIFHLYIFTFFFIDVESEDEDETDTGQMNVTISKTIGNSKVKCSLDIRTQLFIKLIFNDDMFVNQMSSMNLSKSYINSRKTLFRFQY